MEAGTFTLLSVDVGYDSLIQRMIRMKVLPEITPEETKDERVVTYFQGSERLHNGIGRRPQYRYLLASALSSASLFDLEHHHVYTQLEIITFWEKGR